MLPVVDVVRAGMRFKVTLCHQIVSAMPVRLAWQRAVGKLAYVCSKPGSTGICATTQVHCQQKVSPEGQLRGFKEPNMHDLGMWEGKANMQAPQWKAAALRMDAPHQGYHHENENQPNNEN